MAKREKPVFTRPRRLELEYDQAISRVMNEWLNRPALRTLDTILDTLSKYAKIGELLDPQLERIATNMVTAVAEGNSRSWRAAAAKATQGHRIHRLLRAEIEAGPIAGRYRSLIQEHARKISSIPQDLSQEVAAYVQKRSIAGERASTIAAELRAKVPSMAAYRVNMLARTQVASTATALTESRAENLGLYWYEWDTSGDARVRPSHKNLDLVLVNFKHPPAPEALIGIRSTLGHYHAGACPNCRCDANVLVEVDQVSWPHRVYWNERIVRMRKSDFLKIAA